MCGLFQPICQVRYTNVATVRLKKNKEKFEIACYKNKVVNWRSGVENDIHEVLQSPYIFSSISKGKLANNEQLKKAFNTTDIDIIVKQILDKGEFQISKEERNQLLQSTFRDIVSILHEVTINPNTGHPLTRTLLENTLKSSGFSVSLNENAKKQALRALNLLQKKYPENISRCKMRLKVNILSSQYEDVIKYFENKDIKVEHTNFNEAKNVTRNGSNSSKNTLDTTSETSKVKGDDFNSNNHHHEPENVYILLVCPPNLFKDIENYVLNSLDPPGTIQLVTLNIKNVVVDNLSCSDQNSVDSEASQTPMKQNRSSLLEHYTPNIPESSIESSPTLEEQFSSATITPVKTSEDKRMRCTNCNISFEDNSNYRKHFKSDYHVFNSKRKLQNLTPISMEEYQHIIENI